MERVVLRKMGEKKKMSRGHEMAQKGNSGEEADLTTRVLRKKRRLSRKESDVTVRRPRKDISGVSIPIKVNNSVIDECDKPEVLPSFGGRSFDTDARRNMKKATKKIIRP